VATKDGHVVIIPNSSKHWEGLVEAMGSPDWAQEEWCKDEVARSENADRIQPHIRDWAATHTRSEIYHQLQGRGTPAGSVFNTGEVRSWVQYQERGFFVEVDHPEAGTLAYAGSPSRFSTIEWSLGRAPLLGEHNREVYCGELGCDESDLARMAEEGVI